MCDLYSASFLVGCGAALHDGICVFSVYLPCFVHLYMYLLALRVSRGFTLACVCTNVCMSVFESLLAPSGSSRVPDPISCCC